MHLRARMRQLRAERERVRVPDHLGDREGDDVADVPGLRRRTGGHPGQEHRVLGRAEVLRQVLATCRSRSPARTARSGTWRRTPCRRSRTRSRRSSCSPATTRLCTVCVELRADGDVLLVGRLHLAAEHLLHVQPAVVVRLRPAAVVVRPDVDPGHLVTASPRASPSRRPPRRAPTPRPRARARRSVNLLPLMLLLPRIRSAIPRASRLYGIAALGTRRFRAVIRRAALRDRRLGAPREVDPAVGAAPDVLAAARSSAASRTARRSASRRPCPRGTP